MIYSYHMWYDTSLETRKAHCQFHGWIMITLNKWNKMQYRSHPSLVKKEPITQLGYGKYFKNFILIWKPQHPTHSKYIQVAQIQRSSLSTSLNKSFVFWWKKTPDINLDMANKGHGMRFKNLNLLQHQKHVNIIEFSNLLSALVSQDALTIKGFFEEFIIS